MSIRKLRYLSILTLLLVSVTLTSQENPVLNEGPFEQLIIRGVTLINGNGAPPIGPVDIVVEKNKITKINQDLK